MPSKDLTGKSKRGWTITERLGSDTLGRAVWRARHKCGSEDYITSKEFLNRPPRHCRSCKPLLVRGQPRKSIDVIRTAR